jgi:radical SAM superfamily enzyme YgiQ (UPF0313 family)
MRYYGTVIRPPSEAASYLLQVTYGCSHNKCTFCPTYLDKPFKVRPINEVLEDINEAQQLMPYTRRVFLCDGNAMVLNTQQLMTILNALEAAFSELQRVGIYANADEILRKSDDELHMLVAHHLSILYIGLESGSDKVLEKVRKGATVRQIIEAVKKAQEAGFKVSVIALLGLGGTNLWEEHATSTGKAISEMSPRYFSLLTLMLVRGTVLYTQWQKGDFVLPEPIEMLKEMRVIIEHTDMRSGCIFRSNHASNYLPLAGTLPKDKERLIYLIDTALTHGESFLKPEHLRGL